MHNLILVVAVFLSSKIVFGCFLLMVLWRVTLKAFWLCLDNETGLADVFYSCLPMISAKW